MTLQIIDLDNQNRKVILSIIITHQIGHEMRILCINNIIDSKSGGGTASRTKQLCKYLAINGHSTEIISLNIGDMSDSIDELHNVEVTLLQPLNSRFFVPRLSEISKMKQSIKEADIVHIMSHWTFLNIIAAYYARKFSIPYIICPAGALRIFGRSKILKYFFNFIFGNYMLKKAGALIAINKDEYAEFLASNFYHKQIISIIPNGIDPLDYIDKDIEKSFYLPETPFILFLGRLNEIKGPDILFEAFSIFANVYPNVSLVYAGPDEGQQSLIIKKAKEAGLSERIHFTGFLTKALKIKTLSKCKMLVIPSRKEAMSIVVLEGAMLKKPVIFTNECGVDDFEKYNIGISVPVSSDEIAKKITMLLDNDSVALKQGIDAYNFTINNYSWDAIVEKHIQLFSSLVNSNHR